jgi:hypothetical protein
MEDRHDIDKAGICPRMWNLDISLSPLPIQDQGQDQAVYL